MSEPCSPRPDRAARRAVTSVFLANGVAMASFVARIPDVQRGLALPATTLGIVLAGISVGVLLGLTVSGRLIARTGSRRLILLGTGMGALALPLTGAATDPITLTAAVVATGLGTSMMDVGMNAQAIGIERSYGQSIMVGIHGAWSAGTLLAALVGGLATAARVPVATHLAAVAGFIAVLTALASRWLRVADQLEAGAERRFALPRGPLVALALVAMAAALGESTAGQWSGIHLRDQVEVAAARVGWGYVAYTSGMVGVRLIGDALVRRLGVQRVITGGGWLAAGGFLLVASVPRLSASLIGFTLIGLGLGATVPLAFAAAGRLARTPGEGVAAVASVAYLAFLVGPPVIGRLADTLGLSVGFGLVALVLLGLTSRRLPTD